MNIDLHGRKAIVTGSTAGIGGATAEGLARAGASVIVNGRSQARVDEAVPQMRIAFPDGDVTGIKADVSTAEGASAFIAQAPDADILVNNVGTALIRDYHGIASIAAIPDEDWLGLFPSQCDERRAPVAPLSDAHGGQGLGSGRLRQQRIRPQHASMPTSSAAPCRASRCSSRDHRALHQHATGGMVMKIGIVGSGKIGGLVGTLWSHAGHQVVFSSRHPETLSDLVARAGGGARAGTPEEAIAFGDVVLLSIPFVSLPEFGRETAQSLGRKVVLDTSNPYPSRDGSMAEDVLSSGRGTGPTLRDWFPGVRIVRAFNSVWDGTLARETHRAGARVGIPLASDDEEALQVAATLVTDAGFDPVIVGPLDRSREFDVGTAVYDTGMSGPEVREALGLAAA